MSLQLPRFAKKNSLEIERETFEKTQATSLSKAVNAQENAVKEKHIRSAIIGTYQERGAQTFWECVHRIPLKENPIVCWKFCHVLHKVLREGHERVLRDSQRYKPLLIEHGRFWSHLKTGGYGELVNLYCALLYAKLNFHMKNSQIPGNLVVDEHALLKSTGGSDDALFSLAIEMFDYLDCIVELQSQIFKTIESTKQSSMTNAGQCRLNPLIPCIQDSMLLYDYVTKIMFRLHSKLSQDLLIGHRERFLKIFKGLQKFYEKTMSLQYFKNLIEIHHLPKYPPNFLVQSELQNYQPSRVTVLNDVTDQADTISEHLVSLDDTTSTNGSSSPVPDPGVMALYLDKDRQVKELEYQVEGLKLELERLRMQARTQFQQLQFEIAELKQELLLKTQQLAEKEDHIKFLQQHECKVPSEMVERLEKSEGQSRTAEDKFIKIKNMYDNLSSEHVALLRKNAAAKKELEETKKAMNNQSELGVQLEELRRENAELEATLHSKLEENKRECYDLNEVIHSLKAQMHDVENQKSVLQTTLISQVEGKGKECHALQEQIVKLKSQVQIIESAKALQEHDLKSSLSVVTDELESLKASKTLLEDSSNALKGKLNDSELRVLELTKRLDETESSRDSLTLRVKNLSQQLENLLSDELKNANLLLDQQIGKVSAIIKRELEDLENPRVGPEPGLRDFFIYHCEQFEDSIRSLSDSTGKGFDTPLGLINIVDQVQEFGHKVYFLVTYGGPLSRSGSNIQKGDEFLMQVKYFGVSTLDLLNTLKGRNIETLGSGFESLRTSWKTLLELGKNLGLSLSPEADAAEVLDSELHAMEQAIEEAARKMAEMLSKSRASHTGVQLEVNEKLIDSCASLMDAIRVLVQKSKGLQLEIVAQGRGTASAKEFYKRNNQWTEGLISAAKAVGIGAKLLLESADKAVTTKGGGFEYLIASSQEIAASTIQLVVASQVRADRSSNNLALVKQASTGVKTATANVVATAKDCAQLIEESDEIDMTKLSPHQSKRLELELQAELLRKESDLEKSRRRLSALRQHHYHNTES